MLEKERKTACAHFNGDQIQGWMVWVGNDSLAANNSVVRRNLLENHGYIFAFEVFLDSRKEIRIQVLCLILNQQFVAFWINAHLRLHLHQGFPLGNVTIAALVDELVMKIGSGKVRCQVPTKVICVKVQAFEDL